MSDIKNEKVFVGKLSDDKVFSANEEVTAVELEDGRTLKEMIPYPVELREMLPNPNGWKWEAKIEEIGIIAYSDTKEKAFEAVMNRYSKWLNSR